MPPVSLPLPLTETLLPRDAERLRAVMRRVPPGNAGAQNNCGVMLARRGLPLDAAACFERALDIDARMSLAAQNLQQLAARTTVDEARVTQLTATITAHPGDASAALALGKWHARMGRAADAADVLGALLRREPDHLDALREMALVEQALGYPDRASERLSHALTIAPDDVALHALAGEIFYRRGMNEAAKGALDAALAIDDSAAWPQHLLAFVLGDMGHLDAAQAAAQRAMELDPSLARVDMNLALDTRPVRRPQTAVADVEGRTQLNLGLAYRNTGYLEQALAAFDVALQRGEPLGEVHTAIAETRLLQREWALAAAAYADASFAMPGVAAPLIARAAALLRAGDRLDARTSVEHALALEPSAGSALLVLGVLASLEGNAADSLRALQRVRGSSRVELAARLNAAWVMRQLGRHARLPRGVPARDRSRCAERACVDRCRCRVQ